ncbi:MAG: DUF2889 domain-containing protein [Rhodospirillales bacterium]|jgi:hypothetical protein|nr:DUF2889 domain-containing protein [Rhodospirillales bacterium]MDP6883557.1 DUF2889 domain-containing protein [Rhodospirillales bacterium]
MPLSDASPRKHIHTRKIDCRGYHRDDGLWDIEATLVDTKTYSFGNEDRTGIAAGEPVHEMRIRLTIDDDMTVRGAEAVTDAGPFHVCGDVTAGFDQIVGLRIASGWRRAVLARMAGAKGCTHLTDLLVGPLAVTAYQTLLEVRRRTDAQRPAGQKPPLLDTCHAFASTGALAKKRWPEFSTDD